MLPDDLETVLAIEQASYPFPWTKGIFLDCLQGNYVCWTVQPQKAGTATLLGYVIASVAVGECHLLNICIAPDCRGQGIADFLMRELMVEAVSLGASQMFLEVRPSNLAAQVLYRRMGFVEVGRRKNYYPAQVGREDALIWMCNLEVSS